MDAMPQVDEAEFDTLDRYLGSTDASEACMLLSELDGFLTGLVVSPQPIPEDEWLPVALGNPPHFASEVQRELILDIVRRRVAQIEALLRQDPEAYARAMERLMRQNLADPYPPRWSTLLFASHPPAGERIERALAAAQIEAPSSSRALR